MRSFLSLFISIRSNCEDIGYSASFFAIISTFSLSLSLSIFSLFHSLIFSFLFSFSSLSFSLLIQWHSSLLSPPLNVKMCSGRIDLFSGTPFLCENKARGDCGREGTPQPEEDGGEGGDGGRGQQEDRRINKLLDSQTYLRTYKRTV